MKENKKMKEIFKGIVSGIAVLLLVMTGCSDGDTGSNPPDPGTNPDPKVAYVGRVDNDSHQLYGVQSVTTAKIGASTYLFSAGFLDDGISVFSVAADGKLMYVDSADDTDHAAYELDGAYSVTTAEVGGTTYLFVASLADDGISVFSVAADGKLSNVANVSDDGTLQLDALNSITTAEIGGTTYLFAAGFGDDGISVFSVNNQGQLTSVANVDDSDNTAYELDGAASVTTAEIGGITYLFAAGYNDDGISVFSVNNQGQLTSVANVDDSDNTAYELDGAWAVTTAEIGGTTYLFAAGFDDDGISVFSVNNQGQLTSVANVDDSDNTAYELDGAASVTMAEIGGTTYLFAAGYDDNGISMFSVNNQGQLTSVVNVDDSDNTAYELDEASSVTTALIGGTTYLFAAGKTDNGISVFSMATPSTPNHVYSVSKTYRLNAVVSLATATVSGTPYLLAAGELDHGFNSFQIEDSGMLSVKAGVTDNLTYRMIHIKAIATAEVGGNHYAIAAGTADSGISVFGIDASGQLTHTSTVADNGTLMLRGISDVVTVTAGANTYIISAGNGDSGISSFLLNDQGTLTPAAGAAANIADSVTLYLGAVDVLATATMGASPYVFAASPIENGINTFSVAVNGDLANVAAGNIGDSDDAATYNLDGVSALATATVGTNTYLFAGGTDDDGISVFKVANDGSLTHVVSIVDGDNTDYTLDGVAALSTVTKGTETYLMAAANVDNGVSIWTVAQDGMLSFVDSVVDSDSAESKMAGARDVLPVEVNGTLYLYVASYNDDAVNIFSFK